MAGVWLGGVGLVGVGLVGVGLVAVGFSAGLAAIELPASLVATRASGQSPGPVRNLAFEPALDGQGYLIRWDAPEQLSRGAQQALIYEIEDRGDGPWRHVHRGPETRLRVLEMRSGRCAIRVRARTTREASGPWSEIECGVDFDVAPIAALPACGANETTACLLEDRFAVRIRWGSERNDARPLRREADDKQAFAFDGTGVAVTVRILDLCDHNGFFGVEYKARSRAAFRLEITDTQAAQDKSFGAPAGRDRPPQVRYSEAFATCGPR